MILQKKPPNLLNGEKQKISKPRSSVSSNKKEEAKKSSRQNPVPDGQKQTILNILDKRLEDISLNDESRNSGKLNVFSPTEEPFRSIVSNIKEKVKSNEKDMSIFEKFPPVSHVKEESIIIESSANITQNRSKVSSIQDDASDLSNSISPKTESVVEKSFKLNKTEHENTNSLHTSKEESIENKISNHEQFLEGEQFSASSKITTVVLADLPIPELNNNIRTVEIPDDLPGSKGPDIIKQFLLPKFENLSTTDVNSTIPNNSITFPFLESTTEIHISTKPKFVATQKIIRPTPPALVLLPPLPEPKINKTVITKNTSPITNESIGNELKR